VEWQLRCDAVRARKPVSQAVAVTVDGKKVAPAGSSWPLTFCPCLFHRDIVEVTFYTWGHHCVRRVTHPTAASNAFFVHSLHSCDCVFLCTATVSPAGAVPNDTQQSVLGDGSSNCAVRVDGGGKPCPRLCFACGPPRRVTAQRATVQQSRI
jgi:hypothetical protein